MCSVCIAYSFHALFVHGRYRYAVPRSRDFPASIPSQTATATLYESRRSSACERSRLKLQFPCQTRSFRQTLRKQTTSCTTLTVLTDNDGQLRWHSDDAANNANGHSGAAHPRLVHRRRQEDLAQVPDHQCIVRPARCAARGRARHGVQDGGRQGRHDAQHLVQV